MRRFQRLVIAIFVLLLLFAVLTFVLENQQSVSLLFLGWSGPQLPVTVVIVFAMLAVMLIGPVLGWFLGYRSRASRKRLA
jgi:putative membrane protein